MMEKEEKQISINERLKVLEGKEPYIKTKKFRIPRKGKVGRSKIKKGYCTILRIDDNGNVDFEKQKIMDSTYRLTTKEYHTTKEEDILSYKGKPLIIQCTKKLNPYNPLHGKNEVYGQKYIMARMLGDTIKIKSGGSKTILWLIGLAIAGYLGYSIFTGGI